MVRSMIRMVLVARLNYIIPAHLNSHWVRQCHGCCCHKYLRNILQVTKNNVFYIAFFSSLCVLLTTFARADERLVADCADAAQVFLDSLSESQLAKANWPFAGEQRRQWTYYPNVPELDVRTEGLSIKSMSSAQRIAAHRLVDCGLSTQGYQKATGIMRLDDILGQTELYRPKRPEDEAPVGSEKYWLAVFGDPADQDPWGWQLEGHHLALNFTVADGQIAYAPTFMGADPAEVPAGPYAGWRLLGDEVDKALALVGSLNESQRSEAILAGEIPERLFTSPGREDALKEFSGLPAGKLDATQTRRLEELIDVYVGNAAQPIAAKHLEQIRKDLPETWFAWMGPTEKSSGIYYRVHSPSVLIEFVTARNRQSKTREPNPNHVHSIFLYPGNNYGDDLLRHHYETSPDHQHD